MTVLERKAKLITAILNDTDDERFAAIERMYEQLSKPSFMCSVEELNDSLCKQEQDFISGKIVGVPHEQMKQKRKKIS